MRSGPRTSSMSSVARASTWSLGILSVIPAGDLGRLTLCGIQGSVLPDLADTLSAH